MTTIQLITQERHANLRWKAPANYLFAAGSAVVPLAAAELAAAVPAMPIAFLADGDGYVLSALMGVQDGVNLYVAPDGRWLGSYVPAALRGYPFRLARQNDEAVLCIDEASGLVDAAGERFFEEDGKPAQKIAGMLQFLVQAERSRMQATMACTALQKHKVLAPWPLTLRGAQGEQTVNGLFKVDEAALNALPGDALRELADSGALAVAYSQLLSMHQLPLLSKLVQVRAQIAAEMKELAATEPADFLNDGGVLNLSKLN